MISIFLKKSLQFSSGVQELDIKFELATGSSLAIMGNSGAGKTSILRMIAGLMKPDTGHIEINKEIWQNESIYLPPQKRRVGFVFQDYALFPHMSVRSNLTYALDKNQSPKAVDEMLEWMQLHELAGRKPSHLSGGQQQRVALARALIRKPDIVLLDEPLAALDYDLRIKLRKELKTLQSKLGFSIILVSHDPLEVANIADKVLILKNGRIAQSGSPASVLKGIRANEIQGTIMEIFSKKKEMAVLTGFGIVRLALPAGDVKVGDQVTFDFGNLKN